MTMGIKDLFKKKKAPPKNLFDGEEGRDGRGAGAEDNSSGIASFYYSYNGSIGGDSYHYKVCRKDGGWRFFYETMLAPDYGEMEIPADGSAAESLYGLYLSLRIAEWEGYSKYNTMVLDGSGFSLEIRFNDGKYMTASGSNAFPERYRLFVEGISGILGPLADEAMEEARIALIRKGISGALDSAMIYFKQRGASGSDEYDFFITRRGDRSANFDVKVRSFSGEFFPEGSLSLYEDVPDEYTALDGIDALARKHGLIEWLGFEKTDPDYSNKEWFQVSLGFDGGTRIDASGTAYPPGYGEFRKDFLTLMASAAARVQRETAASEETGKDEQ